MNLQEQILKIKKVMGVINESDDPINYLKQEITKKCETIKKDIPPAANKIIDADNVIDQFKKFLLDKIESTIEKSKTGNGGEQFAYECYIKLMQLIDQEIANVNWVGKNLVKAMAPNKNEFIENSKDVNNYEKYFNFFERLVDFPFLIGWMDQFQKNPKIEENMSKYSKQITDWVNKNKKNIVTDITNKLIKFIYG
jgi:hypothetical protein